MNRAEYASLCEDLDLGAATLRAYAAGDLDGCPPQVTRCLRNLAVAFGIDPDAPFFAAQLGQVLAQMKEDARRDVTDG
jgi:hypothetical protein